MLFNIAYFGPPLYFNLRRDFMLALKFGLERLGHRTFLSGNTVYGNAVNLIIGAYFMKPKRMREMTALGIPYINVNTEVIKFDMLNFQPDKVNLNKVYMPFIKGGVAAWDVIQDNMPEYAAREIEKAHFLRWGWLPDLEDVPQEDEKELDFYFFGMMSDRRQHVVKTLLNRGLVGLADDDCPYFVRNDRIRLARVQLNIIQARQYTHVNSFRLCYLANNRCAILSEAEVDPAGYLKLADVAPIGEFADRILALKENDGFRRRGEEAYETFRQTPMTECLGPLLEATFAKS